MRKILFGVFLAAVVLFIFKYCESDDEDSVTVIEGSILIQEQIKNVGKLVVTEGHFSEVFNYENSKQIFGDFLSFEKKALVVVNADVTIAYDLNLIQYEVDEETQTLHITSIPEEEIKIAPELEYYDIQADYFNPFEAEDHNQIKETVKKTLLKKLESSGLRDNAMNRLLSELSKFYILTNSLGWTLKYNGEPVKQMEDFTL